MEEYNLAMKKRVSTTMGMLVLSIALAISVTLVVSSAQDIDQRNMQASANDAYVPS